MAKYEDFCEKRITHLQMIEAVIDRMAANSLRMKEWFVTVGSAIVGFAVTKGNLTLALVALGPLVLFWVLDAFYLYQERLFRFQWRQKKVSANSFWRCLGRGQRWGSMG